MTIYLLILMHVNNCVTIIKRERAKREQNIGKIMICFKSLYACSTMSRWKLFQTSANISVWTVLAHTHAYQIYYVVCYVIYAILYIRLSWWVSGKECSWQRRRLRKLGFDPWVGKILWRRKLQSIPVLLPGKFHGQRNLVGYSPWSCKESETAEQVNMNTYIIYYITYFRDK